VEPQENIVAKKLLRDEAIKKMRQVKSAENYTLCINRITESFSSFFKEYGKSVRSVMIYDPLPSELPISEIINSLGLGLNLYYPKIDGDRLLPFSGIDNRIADWGEIDLVVVPGVLATREGFRLGRGGGYYDRLLSVEDSFVTLFAGYDWQIVDTLPVDPWDQPVNYILTDKGVSPCG